jgi:hypothetical protein
LNALGTGLLSSRWCEPPSHISLYKTHTAHTHTNNVGGATSLVRQDQPQRSPQAKRGRGAGAAAPAALVDRNRGLERPNKLGSKMAKRSEPLTQPYADNQSSRGWSESTSESPRHPEVAVGHTLTPTANTYSTRCVRKRVGKGLLKRYTQRPILCVSAKTVVASTPPRFHSDLPQSLWAGVLQAMRVLSAYRLRVAARTRYTVGG